MDYSYQNARKSLKNPGLALVINLIGHIKDPETGERLIDDASFKNLINSKIKSKAA